MKLQVVPLPSGRDLIIISEYGYPLPTREDVVEAVRNDDASVILVFESEVEVVQ